MQYRNDAEMHSALHRGRSVSPTGGLFIVLSASGLPMMAATTAQCKYFLHIIPEQEPDFFRQRHINMKIGQKNTHAGTTM
jgi:hypothetical protein